MITKTSATKRKINSPQSQGYFLQRSNRQKKRSDGDHLRSGLVPIQRLTSLVGVAFQTALSGLKFQSLPIRLGLDRWRGCRREQPTMFSRPMTSLVIVMILFTRTHTERVCARVFVVLRILCSTIVPSSTTSSLHIVIIIIIIVVR